MSSGRSRSKAKSRKDDRENIPVSWISVQPDAPTRTSLRSVADYLSEKEAESPLLQHRSNRSLRLSPTSLQALERAERLVEDAERQLSRLNLDAVLADECDGDGLLEETSAYIRRIVATSFETGAYEPPSISEALIPGRSRDAIGIVDERGETGGEDSLHETSHLIDSLSDDQALRQLSAQLTVQSQLDSKAAQDNRRSSASSVGSARPDGILTASAELIVGRQTSVGLDRATAREYSRVSANNRPLLTAYQHDGIVLLEPPSSDPQKLNLLEKLESCSIPNRHHYCKRLPFTSTVLSDAAQPAGSNAESSELSSEAAHSEGEFCLSSSASYSLGEVRRKDVNSIAGSQSCSTKVSSTSSAISQLEA
ncbi:hypothetical protein TSAR_004872, partial [Trichomalopsis sarcophagae]